MARIQTEYWAGFADAESCISILYSDPDRAGKSGRFSLSVQIPNCHQGIIKLLENEIGGGSYVKNKKPKERQAWQWYANSNVAASFLESIEPYAIIKKEQINIALEFWLLTSQRHGSTPITSVDLALRHDLRDQIAHLKAKPNNQSQKVDRAVSALFWAGFFDGEGHIGINYQSNSAKRRSPHFQLVVQAKNTHEHIMLAMHEQWGGHLHRSIPGGQDRKPYWHWSCVSNMAIPFLQAVEPYLIIKREEAQIALEFSEHLASGHRRGGCRGMSPLTPEQIAIRTDYMLRLKALH